MATESPVVLTAAEQQHSEEYLLLPLAYLCLFVGGYSQCLLGFCSIFCSFHPLFGLFFLFPDSEDFEMPNTPLVAAAPHLELEITIIVCRDTAVGEGGGATGK